VPTKEARVSEPKLSGKKPPRTKKGQFAKRRTKAYLKGKFKKLDAEGKSIKEFLDELTKLSKISDPSKFKLHAEEYEELAEKEIKG
jgi:hypothetical protein